MMQSTQSRWLGPIPPPAPPSSDTVSERQIPAAMERVAVTIEMCRQSVRQLGERLSPVLEPPGPSADKGEIARRTACPLAESLFGMAEQLEQLSRWTDSLRDQVQV